MTSSLQGARFSSRRRFLQQTLSGIAGWALALLDLMIANVIVELGDTVNQRVDQLTRLQDVFGDFQD